MKKTVFLIIALILALSLIFVACGNNNNDGSAPSNSESSDNDPIVTPPDNDPPSSNEDLEYTLYINGESDEHKFVDGELKVELMIDDTVTIKSSNDDILEDDYTASVFGIYTFTISDGRVEIDEPSKKEYDLYIDNSKKGVVTDGEDGVKVCLSAAAKIKLVDDGEEIFSENAKTGDYVLSAKNGTVIKIQTKKQAEGIMKVYYSKSKDGWGDDIYAYCWDSVTGSQNDNWPGQKCVNVGKNEYEQNQYSYDADLSSFDRIIFNDGNGNQTMNLALNPAVSAYYDVSSPFVYGASGYGKVEYHTLEDKVNLAHRSDKKKKISVYLPEGYDTSKKYGILVMFDQQNIYGAAEGAAPTADMHGSWAVDVAITALIKNTGVDGVIVLGIDNSDQRNSELTMSLDFGELVEELTEGEADVEGFSNGHLDDLGNFILQTALPFVREHYSVDDSYLSTGICGSSSGGLAAYYIGLRDLGTYGYIGAFSPAVGLFKSEAWDAFYEAKDFENAGILPELYIYCGSGDDSLEDMLLPSTKNIYSDLTKYGYDGDLIVEVYTGKEVGSASDKSEHTEEWWRIMFGDFLYRYVK